MTSLGWRSIGLLELTALPGIDPDRWHAWLTETDALLVDGGDATLLTHHPRACGPAELLPSLDIVWVGVSAGSTLLPHLARPRDVRDGP